MHAPEHQRMIKGSGEFEAITAGTKLHDLTVTQVAPNSQDWILTKTISYRMQGPVFTILPTRSKRAIKVN